MTKAINLGRWVGNSNYHGKCSCGETYIRETVQKVEVCWKEHNSSSSISEPSKHLKENEGHSFDWRILMMVPQNNRARRYLEASQIALRQPTLNNKLETKLLHLFRNGVTWRFSWQLSTVLLLKKLFTCKYSTHKSTDDDIFIEKLLLYIFYILNVFILKKYHKLANY